MSRKLFSLITCIVLVLNFEVIPGSAQAEENDAIAEAVMAVGGDSDIWQQINTDGFGDPNNASAIPIVFNGKLYATTGNNASGANIWEYQDGNPWNNVINDGFGNTQNYWISSGIIFNQELYLSTSNNTGAEIWRSSDGNTWTQVVMNGFGDPSNYSIYAFEIFDDILYAGTVNNTKGGQLWYSVDGNTWFNANPDGFGQGNWGIWGLASFHGDLYAGFGGNASIWKSPDGMTWTPVASGGFGDPGNIVIGYTMKVFNNALYATTANLVTGAEIWRTLDGNTWDQVNEDGFGNAQQNEGARTLFVFRGELYAGVRNNAATTSLWKTKDGTSWEEVNGDGFGDLGNFAIWGIAQYQGNLIVGTQNNSGGEVWKLYSKSNNEKPGSISGTVTDDGTGEPIEGIFVFACEVDVYCDSTLTDSKGFYKISLPPGTYRVGTYSETDYVPEFYNDKFYWDEADDVLVTAKKETRNINFALLPAGSISGTVIDENTNLPVVGVDVVACYFDNFDICWWDDTAEDGSYQITGVPIGEFRVHVWSQQGYVEEFYNNVPNYDWATPVSVSAQIDTPNINFTLELGSSISGIVTEYETGMPLVGLTVEACDYEAEWDGPCFYGNVEADGGYIIYDVPVGTYRVHTGWDGNWVEEYYPDTTNWELAEPVQVLPDTNTPDIDFALVMGGSISGTVTEETTGDPIAGLDVVACDYDAEWDGPCFYGNVEADGSYIIQGIPVGTYRVNTGWDGNWVEEFYPDTIDWGSAEPVQVLPDTNTPDIDFALALGGSISGMIAEEGTGDPIEGQDVEACEYYDDEWDGPCFYGGTEADGSYFIRGVPVGIYRVHTGWDGNWVEEYYPDTINWELAEPVQVLPDTNTPDIDFALVMGGSISGTVTEETTGDPIAGLDVVACDVNAPEYDCSSGGTVTETDGSYTIPRLAEGNYYVFVYQQGNWFGEFYDNAPVWGEAEPVEVKSDKDTPDIDFALVMGGSISGVVTDSGGNPLANMGVDIMDGGYGTCTDENGNYTIAGLPFGTYDIVAGRDFCGSHSYTEQIINNVTVDADNPNISGYDFALSLGGSISGTVYEENSGDPLATIAGIQVDACSPDDTFCKGIETNELGEYTITGLPAGDYRVHAYQWPEGNWIDEVYEETRDWDAYTPVSVTAGLDTPNISFTLELGGAITGVVEDGDGNDVEGIWVVAHDYVGDYFVSGAQTDATGTYRILGLPAGTYRVFINPQNGWTGQEYSPSPVTVTAGSDTYYIDFTLLRDSTISGIVTDELGNHIPDRIDVAACWVTAPDDCFWTTVEEDTYTIIGLPSGEFYVNVYEVPEEGMPGGNWIGYTYPSTIKLGVDDDVFDINFILMHE